MEEILQQLIGSLSNCFQGFIYPRWLFRTSSINSIAKEWSYLTSQFDLKSWYSKSCFGVWFYHHWQSTPKNGQLLFSTSEKRVGRRFFTDLVGGWTNPSEKYARQIGNLPQIGMKVKHIWNPPPSDGIPCSSGLKGVKPWWCVGDPWMRATWMYRINGDRINGSPIFK